MVTEREAEQMKRGFAGGGVIIAGVMALAALIAVVLEQDMGALAFHPSAGHRDHVRRSHHST